MYTLKEIIGADEKEEYNEFQILQAKKWVNEADHFFFYTGAGMSVASGIATFRGSYGLWTLYKRVVLYYFFIWISLGFILYFMPQKVLWCFQFVIQSAILSAFYFFNKQILRYSRIAQLNGYLFVLPVTTWIKKHKLYVFWIHLFTCVVTIFIPFFVLFLIIGSLGLLFSVVVLFISIWLTYQVTTGDGWKNHPYLCWWLFGFFFLRPARKAEFNDGHRAIFNYKNKNHMKSLNIITSNVDGLEGTLKSDFIRLQHGKITELICPKCNRRRFKGLKQFSILFPEVCLKCNNYPMRPTFLLFDDSVGKCGQEYGELPETNDDTNIHFIIGHSGVIGMGITNYIAKYPGRIIEINLAKPKSCAYNEYNRDSESYMWIQARQEIVLPQILKK